MNIQVEPRIARVIIIATAIGFAVSATGVIYLYLT